MHDLARIVMAMMVALVAVSGTFSSGAAQGDDSGGIGLDRADWEEVYGDGEAGQNLMEYRTRDSLPIYVGFDSSVVAFIEVDLTGADGGGLAEELAVGLVEQLMPTDADVRESFTMPATPSGPIGLRAETWDSEWLEDNVDEDRETVLVVYQEQQAEESMDIVVTTVTMSLED